MLNQEQWAKKDLEYIWHPCSQMKDYEHFLPIVIDHAKGTVLTDVNGKTYLDVVSSWWCNLLGHCNPIISRAVKNQLDQLEHVIFANFTHKPAIKLCEELAQIVPKGLCKFNFMDNGSASIEAAMKMSFQYHHQTGNPQKVKFMALSDAYHGETLGALGVGGVDLYSEMYKPLLLDTIRIPGPDCYRCPKNLNRETCQAECIDQAEHYFAQYANETAAMLVEPLLQGAAGMKIYPPIYLRKIRELCTRYQVHLIADEIATGFGRTGTMFACEQAEITPDIMCISKGLTGGYMPMAITITTQCIYDAFYADYLEGKAFMHSHTYSGNPLGCSAALAVLGLFAEEDILSQTKAKAPVFHQMVVEALSEHPNVGEIRTIGLINAIELVANKETKEALDSKNRTGYQIYKEALNRGLLLRPLGDVLYFNPPLTITEEEMKQAVAHCKAAITAILG